MHAMHAFRTLVALCLYVRLLEKKVQPYGLDFLHSPERGARETSECRDRGTAKVIG